MRMNDRYLFKAKRKDFGEWVFGGLAYCEKNGAYFITKMGKDNISYIGYFQEIDPSTICQCTGWKDKNGKLIWENDIVKDDKGNFYKAFWQEKYYQFSWVCVKSEKLPVGAKWNLNSFKGYEMEIISNVFDNQELLEE